MKHEGSGRMNENKVLIKGGTLFSDGQMIDNPFLKIKGETIIDSGIWNEDIDVKDYKVLDLKQDYKIVPGFIDIHIHGANNADVMDATPEALDKIAHVLPSEGTTSFLATTITSGQKECEKALINAGEYIRKHQKKGNAEVLGIHLEGPFINPVRAGAQPLKDIMTPDFHLLQAWQEKAGGHIRQVTLAPELEGSASLISYLKKEKVIASIGHSDASYDEVMKAKISGVSCVTHLFNQMSGLHHREAGVAGAALLQEGLQAELIVDGLHVKPEVVKLAYKQKGKDGLILITDSMRAKHCGEGEFELGGQKVTVKSGMASLENGTLAGSVLKMSDAIRNVMEFTGCTLAEAVTMGAVNPAEQLGLSEKKGSLSKGKDADVVVLDKENSVIMTFCKGILAYEKEDSQV